MATTLWDTAKPGVLTILLGALACGGAAEAGSSGDEAAEEPFARVINVVTEQVALSAFTEQIRLTGTVRAARDVTVSAEESGVVRELLVEKGMGVQQGQPLMRIDDRVLRPQVDQARAQAALATEAWERRKRLFEQDHVGSELAYLEARYGAEQAEAHLAMLEERLTRTVVRAPVEGVLEDRFVEIGSLVAPGTAVARVLDVDPVKVVAGVPERYATDVRPGAPLRVTFDVLEGRVFEGAVAYVGAAVDAGSRTFPVEFTIPNPGSLIKPEMVANVAVVRRALDEAIVVPLEAVVRVSDGYAVFLVRSEGEVDVVEARSVQLGASQGSQVVITSGLQPGDQLVVQGQQQVTHGDRVRVVEER